MRHVCSAPTCHVTNVRSSIDSPHQAVIPRLTPEYQCLWFQLYRASNFYCMAMAAESSSPTSPPSAADWVAFSVRDKCHCCCRRCLRRRRQFNHHRYWRRSHQRRQCRRCRSPCSCGRKQSSQCNNHTKASVCNF